MARLATRLQRRPGTHSPSLARTPADSPASSYRSTRPAFPPIEKWTVASLRQALTNSDIQAPRKFTKAELYEFCILYKNFKPTNLSPKTTPASKVVKKRDLTVTPRQTPPSSSSSKTSSRKASNCSARPSASQGRATDSADARPSKDLAAAQLSVLAPSLAIPRPTTQEGVWPPPPPVSAPLPTPLSSEPSAQASSWPPWPAYTALPPASLSSEPVAQACVWLHGQPHSAPQPTPFGSGLTAQASDWPLWPPYPVQQPTPSSSGISAQANA